MSTEAQEATNRTIVNFLEWALCAEVSINGPSNNTNQATNIYTQPASSGSSVQSCVGSQHSSGSNISRDIINAPAPEELLDHVDNNLPSSDGSMAQYEVLNENRMSVLSGQA
jgi:hypothetical protein